MIYILDTHLAPIKEKVFHNPNTGEKVTHTEHKDIILESIKTMVETDVTLINAKNFSAKNFPRKNDVKLIITGSAYSVVGQEEWIKNLIIEIKKLKNHTNVSIFGICFGAQILAHIAEMDIQKLPYYRRKKLNVTIQNYQEKVLFSHEERIVSPPGTQVITDSEGIPTILKFHEKWVGFQFHPELSENPQTLWKYAQWLMQPSSTLA